MSTADVAPVANALMTALTTDAPFTIPTFDFSGAEFAFPADALNHNVVPLTPTDITNGAVDGPGIFDLLMRGFKAHLTVEFEAGRITGSDYTKAYIALTESAMSQGIAFMLGKDTSFWQALNLKVQAFNSRVALEQAKVQAVVAQFAAVTGKAEYALTKLKLASEGSAYNSSEFNLANVLPKQALLLTEQVSQTTQQTIGIKADSEIKQYQLANTIPKQLELLVAQVLGQVTENDASRFNVDLMLPEQLATVTVQKEGYNTANATATYNLNNLMPAQLLTIQQQRLMLTEQTEAQRAQTTDLRTDGLGVTGVMGKQKDLYAQQVTSYQRDAEVKAGKLFTDAWITMKSIDEGLLPPAGFANASIDTVLTAIKTNNELN